MGRGEEELLKASEAGSVDEVDKLLGKAKPQSGGVLARWAAVGLRRSIRHRRCPLAHWLAGSLAGALCTH